LETKEALVQFELDRFASPLGDLLLVTDGEGSLRALDFHDYEDRMRGLLRRRYGAFDLRTGRAPASLRASLAAYFGGEIDGLANIRVETGGTAFQALVWAALRAIPAGATTTYGKIAAALGKPKACRAVGLANGANAISIVVPCHRVIGADASLTGFGGGLNRKRWLLDHERAPIGRRSP
jgi:methylated-DNA-[protein]-cysteine S-methyltransferase